MRCRAKRHDPAFYYRLRVLASRPPACDVGTQLADSRFVSKLAEREGLVPRPRQCYALADGVGALLRCASPNPKGSHPSDWGTPIARIACGERRPLGKKWRRGRDWCRRCGSAAHSPTGRRPAALRFAEPQGFSSLHLRHPCCEFGPTCSKAFSRTHGGEGGIGAATAAVLRTRRRGRRPATLRFAEPQGFSSLRLGHSYREDSLR